MLIWRALSLLAAVGLYGACLALGVRIVRRARERPWAARWATLALWWMALASLARAHPWLLDAPCRALELKPVATLSLRAWVGSGNWIVAQALLCVGLFGGPWRLRIPGQGFGAGRRAAASWAGLTMVAAVAGLPLMVVAVSVLPKLLVPEVPAGSSGRPEPPQRWDASGLSPRLWVSPRGLVYAQRMHNGVVCYRDDGWQPWFADMPEDSRAGEVVGVDSSGALVASALKRVGANAYSPDPGGYVLVDESGRLSVVRRAVGQAHNVMAVVPGQGGRTVWLTRGSRYTSGRWRPEPTRLEAWLGDGDTVVARQVLVGEPLASQFSQVHAAAGGDSQVWFAGVQGSGISPAKTSVVGSCDTATGRVTTQALAADLRQGLAVDPTGLVLWAGPAGRLVGWRAGNSTAAVEVTARPAGRVWQVVGINSCRGQVYFIDNTPDGFRLRRLLEATPRPAGARRWDPRDRLSRDVVILLATCQPWLVVAVALGLLALSQATISPWQARCALEASALVAAFGVVVVLLVPTGILTWFCRICDQAFLGLGTSERLFGGSLAGELLLGIGRVVVTVVLLKGCLFGPVEALMPGVAFALPPDRRRQNVRLAMVLMAFSAVVSLVPVAYWWY